MRPIIVMGGSGGLGQEICKLLPEAVDWSKDSGVNFVIEEDVEAAAHCLEGKQVRGVINCCGINALIPFDEVTFAEFARSMYVNVYSLVRVVQALRREKLLADGAAICNVISNAAHIPMTHSLIYNTSKAAQEMLTRQMARELKEYCVFGVNPNKLEGTPMSREIEAKVLELRGWTAEQAKKYQLAALPAGVETPPESLARFIVHLMGTRNHPYITGTIFPYGGPQ